MAEQHTGIGISIKNLYQIFGSDPAAYIDDVKAGMTKAELNDKHNHVLGLKDINIDMPGGGIQVVMGLSGSGKSTMVRMLNRLIDPTVGEVLVGGVDVADGRQVVHELVAVPAPTPSRAVAMQPQHALVAVESPRHCAGQRGRQADGHAEHPRRHVGPVDAGRPAVDEGRG